MGYPPASSRTKSFGDGVRVDPNLDLEPEQSHNGNLGFTAETIPTPAGACAFDIKRLPSARPTV